MFRKYLFIKYTFSIIIVGILFYISFHLYKILAIDEYDELTTVLDYLNVNCAEQEQCSVSLDKALGEDNDYYVYFNGLDFSMDKKCGDLNINPHIRGYMNKYIDCNFLLGVKDNVANSLFLSSCVDTEFYPKIIFRNKEDHLNFGTGQMLSGNFIATSETGIGYQDEQYYALTASDDVSYLRNLECKGI